MTTHFFAGPKALQDFMDPSCHAPTPLVEIPADVHGIDIPGLRVFAKLMQMLPLGNVKSVPAFSMLEQARRGGKLKHGSHLVESSSGNTVFSLGLLAKAFGIDEVHAFASDEVAQGKLDMLRLAGVHVRLHCEPICPRPDDPQSGIQKARRLAQQPGWLNLDQYTNPANPAGHAAITAPQIFEQLQGQISVFAAGLGTTGTFSGVSTALKKLSADITTVGVVRAPNNPVPGVRTETLLAPTGFSYEEHMDALETVGTQEAYKTSLDLIRAGLLVGPSSGFALAGLRAYIQTHRAAMLDRHVREGYLHCVFICCDTPYPYMEDYFRYLDPALFPPITRDGEEHREPQHFAQVQEVAAQQAYEALYDVPVDEAWHMLHHGQEPALRASCTLLDLSPRVAYDEAHAPGAQLVNLDTLADKASALSGKHVYILCPYGGASLAAIDILARQGIHAVSIAGGMLSWSRGNLPRVRHDNCILHKAPAKNKKVSRGS